MQINAHVAPAAALACVLAAGCAARADLHVTCVVVARALLQVLPSLREHREEVLLKELHQRWNNHKLMVRWLSRFFNYLDRWERDAGARTASTART